MLLYLLERYVAVSMVLRIVYVLYSYSVTCVDLVDTSMHVEVYCMSCGW
jgi:hypothetical protein